MCFYLFVANCTAGYKTVNDVTSVCEECPRGEYQADKWQESCDSCPSGETTEFTARTSQDDCIGKLTYTLMSGLRLV